MYEINQSEIPPSFVALFVPPGRLKPTEPREVVAARYELCEDMANMLTEHAKTMQFSLGVTEADVLQRCHRGLMAEGGVFSGPEAGWVIHRLAELLDWPMDFKSPDAQQSSEPDAG